MEDEKPDTLLIHAPAWLARALVAVRMARVSTIGKRTSLVVVPKSPANWKMAIAQRERFGKRLGISSGYRERNVV